MDLSRRQLMKTASISTLGLLLPSVGLANVDSKFRSIGFKSLHTGEAREFEYMSRGEYVPDAIAAMNHLLRDHRTNEVMVMDIRLIESLHVLRRSLGKSEKFNLISAYRSPKTNAMLSGKSGAVAKKSYHMRGMAIDIAMPGVQLNHLHTAAKSLKVGGVGAYSGSGFVHMDTGPVRYW